MYPFTSLLRNRWLTPKAFTTYRNKVVKALPKGNFKVLYAKYFGFAKKPETSSLDITSTHPFRLSIKDAMDDMQDVHLMVIHVLSRYLHIEIRSFILITRGSIGSKLPTGL